jgi:hypothetical protein
MVGPFCREDGLPVVAGTGMMEVRATEGAIDVTDPHVHAGTGR